MKENYFSPYSHGFRPGKSFHTALEQIKTKWTAIPWYIKFDIVKYFDNINRNILINQLNKKIKDRRFIDLFQKMFKAGILITGSKENQSQIIQESLGVPQGNILSPILSNIFLTPFDNFMQQLIQKYHKGKKASINTEYVEETTITEEDLSKIPKEKQTAQLIRRNKSRIVNRKLAMQNRRSKIFCEQILKGFRTRFKQAEDKGNITQWKQNLEKALDIVISADKSDNASRQVFTQFIKELDKFWHLDQDSALRNFLENDDNLNPSRIKEAIKKDPILIPITRKEILRRIVIALELENLKAPGSKFGKYGSLFNKVGDILYCPDVIVFSSLLKEKLNQINKDTYNERFKGKKFLKEILYWLKEEGQNKEPSVMNSKMAEKVREHWENNKVRTSLPPQITIDLDKLYKKLEQNKIINNKKKPISKTNILIAEDYYIIKYYNNTAYGLMSYFRCATNINKLKEIIAYHLRYSLIYTLMNKHKLSSVKSVLEIYGKKYSSCCG